MTDFVLGINTCFAVKRWPQPADWAGFVRRELDLDVVQHSLDLVDLDGRGGWLDQQAAEVREACDDFALEVHSTFTGLAAYSSNLLLHPDERARQRAEEWYRRAIQFTSAVDADATGGHLGAYSVDDFATPDRRRLLDVDLHARLTRLRREAKRCGVRAIYVENLAARREPSVRAEIDDLLAAEDDDHAAVELCLDVGHQCVPGTVGAERDPYDWLRTHGATAGVIQLQQSDDLADHHWPFTPETNACGRIDAGRVLETLVQAGATTCVLILEVIPAFEAADADVARDLARSVEYWKDALARYA